MPLLIFKETFFNKIFTLKPRIGININNMPKLYYKPYDVSTTFY